MGFLKKVGLAFAKGITNISLFLSILFMILSIFFILVSGGSLLTAYLILQKHPIITTFAIIISLWIGATLPASITSLLIPEAVVSKIAGGLGISTNIASALVLFIMVAFFSAIGILVSLILAIIFLVVALLFKRISKKEKGILIFIAGILCLTLSLWFFVAIFLVKGIIFIMVISLILCLIFLSIGINLLLPYFKTLFSKNKRKT
ncbi:hypothetical protein HYS72_03165 [Candidatus Pacearchaeota archaeon]|nr:hypothetical protein [Candidatus Pacearchaeota archaeon]MBI2056629.1 hypothetical protein [Candidatus Pacearchaeota archaeon]